MEAGVYGVEGRLAELLMDNQIESQMDDKMTLGFRIKATLNPTPPQTL